MTRIAYARVSTAGQTLDVQIEQLTAEGCDLIFRETASGAKSNRPELAKALATLSEGDVFVVTRLDRLARSTFDLLQTVRAIEAKSAKLKSLAEAWADMTTPAGKLILGVQWYRLEAGKMSNSVLEVWQSSFAAMRIAMSSCSARLTRPFAAASLRNVARQVIMSVVFIRSIMQKIR